MVLALGVLVAGQKWKYNHLHDVHHPVSRARGGGHVSEQETLSSSGVCENTLLWASIKRTL